MVFINPVVDFILGASLGFAVYFTATDSWWMVPHMLRKLKEIID